MTETAPLWKLRKIIKTLDEIGRFLTDDEISDIGLILLRAMKRIEKEELK